jgi:hypothetical protein
MPLLWKLNMLSPVPPELLLKSPPVLTLSSLLDFFENRPEAEGPLLVKILEVLEKNPVVPDEIILPNNPVSVADLSLLILSNPEPIVTPLLVNMPENKPVAAGLLS